VDETRKDDAAWLSRPALEYAVHNVSQSFTLADRVTIAGTSYALRRLLNVNDIPDGLGIWIGPCEAVHTFGRKAPIDVLFLDRRFIVCRLMPHLPPRRVSVCLAAESVLELQPGAISRTGTKVGDHLLFESLL
jgi:hypothetical protein